MLFVKLNNPLYPLLFCDLTCSVACRTVKPVYLLKGSLGGNGHCHCWPCTGKPKVLSFSLLKSHFYFHILEVSENKVHIL